MTSLKDFSLEGKNAWITGASYGIGFNIAKAFVAAGVKNIIFNDINEAALERGLANYKEAGIENVHGYVCDVTDENAVKALVETIHKEVGNIDILVNNAGISGQKALLESYGERICKDDLEPGFFVDFFIKDMKLAYDSAKLGGLELDVLGRVIENYQKLSNEGLGRAGMQALIKHYEK